MTGLSQMEVLPAASARYAKIRLLVSESDCTVVQGTQKFACLSLNLIALYIWLLVSKSEVPNVMGSQYLQILYRSAEQCCIRCFVNFVQFVALTCYTSRRTNTGGCAACTIMHSLARL